jgi:hypothetical protein
VTLICVSPAPSQSVPHVWVHLCVPFSVKGLLRPSAHFSTGRLALFSFWFVLVGVCGRVAPLAALDILNTFSLGHLLFNCLWLRCPSLNENQLHPLFASCFIVFELLFKKFFFDTKRHSYTLSLFSLFFLKAYNVALPLPSDTRICSCAGSIHRSRFHCVFMSVAMC